MCRLRVLKRRFPVAMLMVAIARVVFAAAPQADASDRGPLADAGQVSFPLTADDETEAQSRCDSEQETDRPAWQQLSLVQDPRIAEGSGLAMSRQNPGCFWVHNDSGDTAQLFLVRTDGTTRAAVALETGRPVDWEDICSFEADGVSWLLVADTGDNAARQGRGTRSSGCRLLLIREQTLPDLPDIQMVRWPVHHSIEFVYEDGPRDCESVGVDVSSRTILLLSKSLPQQCGLYALPLHLDGNLHRERAQRIASPGALFATAMDISPRGDRLLIATLLTGALIERQGNEAWESAFSRPAAILQLPPRKQGESVCFTLDGAAVLLHSEGVGQPLWQLPLPRIETSVP